MPFLEHFRKSCNTVTAGFEAVRAVDGEDVRFKLIDLGSSFPFEAINDKVELTTPEYLPPEILDYLENKAKLLDVEVIA